MPGGFGGAGGVFNNNRNSGKATTATTTTKTPSGPPKPPGNLVRVENYTRAISVGGPLIECWDYNTRYLFLKLNFLEFPLIFLDFP